MQYHRTVTVALFASAVMVAGCAGVLDRVHRHSMLERIEYGAFSVERPPNNNWSLLRSQQGAGNAQFDRHIDSDTHTMYASVELLVFPEEVRSAQDKSRRPEG